MQVPSNAIMNHVGRPSLYLGFFTAAWGLVSLLTSQVKSFGSIVACRFILGIVEAPFFAGVLFYLSKWYTKKELNLRMSIFYSASLMSGAFGPLIAAGILNGMDGARGMSAWQWVSTLSKPLPAVAKLTFAIAVHHRGRIDYTSRNYRHGRLAGFPRHLESAEPRGETCGKPTLGSRCRRSRCR